MVFSLVERISKTSNFVITVKSIHSTSTKKASLSFAKKFRIDDLAGSDFIFEDKQFLFHYYSESIQRQ